MKPGCGDLHSARMFASQGSLESVGLEGLKLQRLSALKRWRQDDPGAVPPWLLLLSTGHHLLTGIQAVSLQKRLLN